MKIHKKIANLFGFELIPFSRFPSIEGHIKAIIKHFDINLIIDIGANTGQYASMLRKRVGYRGDIHSFEPVPDVYRQLEKNSSHDTHWYTHQIALGDQDSEKKIHVTRSSDYSSFLTPNDNSRRLRENDTIISKSETVKIKRLDEYLLQTMSDFEPDNHRIYLKLDTQGYDLVAMRGCLGLLKNIKAIQTELSFLPIYIDMPDYIESLQYYRNIGFAPSGFHPVSREPESMQLIEADCILVKTS